MQTAVIKYGCNCGRNYNISDLYYCQGCQRVLCKYCVTEEIESYFCPNCLENLASAEASMFANKCKKCFQCPICFCALNLSSLANSEQVFLSCGFCRWNSLHLRLVADNPTKLVSDINKLEREDPLQADLAGLLDELRRHFKDQLRDKRHKEKFRHHSGSGIQRLGRASEALRDSLGSVSASASTSSAPFSLGELETRRAAQEHQLSFKGKQEQVISKRTSSTSAVAPDPAAETIALSSTTTLEQRFANLSTQPTDAKALMPSRIELDTRRTKRCRDCDKLLIKPDLSPVKVEFKRHLVALLYVPKLTLVPFSSWPVKVAPAANAFVLCISNPLKSAMQITLAQLVEKEENKNSALPTVTVTLPKDSVTVGPTDYVEGAEEEYEEAKKKDTPAVVSQRRGNRLYLHGIITTSAPSPSLRYEFKQRERAHSVH